MKKNINVKWMAFDGQYKIADRIIWGSATDHTCMFVHVSNSIINASTFPSDDSRRLTNITH